MNRLIFRFPLLFVLTAILLFQPTHVQSDPPVNRDGISARLVADFVHSVIEAGRTTYSQAVVDRLNKSDILSTTENWKQENTLPLPAQFLMKSSHMSNQRGIGMRLPIDEPVAYQSQKCAAFPNRERGLKTGRAKTQATLYLGRPEKRTLVLRSHLS